MSELQFKWVFSLFISFSVQNYGGESIVFERTSKSAFATPQLTSTVCVAACFYLSAANCFLVFFKFISCLLSVRDRSVESAVGQMSQRQDHRSCIVHSKSWEMTSVPFYRAVLSSKHSERLHCLVTGEEEV